MQGKQPIFFILLISVLFSPINFVSIFANESDQPEKTEQSPTEQSPTEQPVAEGEEKPEPEERNPVQEKWQELFFEDPFFYGPWFQNLLLSKPFLATDEESLELVNSVLNDPEMLGDDEIVVRLELIIGRLNLVRMLRSIVDVVVEKGDQDFVFSCLEDPSKLDEPAARKKARLLVKRVLRRQKIRRMSSFRRKKNIVTGTYAAYRKIMYLKALDSGYAAGWVQKLINGLAAAAYLGGEVYETYLASGSDTFQTMMNVSQDPDLMGKWGKKVISVPKDEISDYISEKIDKKSKYMKRRRAREDVATAVHKFGAQGEEVDPPVMFDSYLDREISRGIENALGSLLEKARIPDILKKGAKGVWRNRITKFIRKMFFFRVLPTWLYWKCKMKWGYYKGKNKKFVDYIPFKEAVKSIGGALKSSMEEFIISKLDVGEDGNGRGRFTRMKDYTCGLIGPNIVPLGLGIVTPYIMFNVTDKIKPGFLTKKDYGISRKKTTQQVVAQKMIHYSVKSMLSYMLVKVLRFVRPLLFSGSGKKGKRFLEFLSRRNVISESWVDGSSAAILSQFGPQAVVGTYNFFWGSSSKATDYDMEEAYEEMSRSGDVFRFFDYVIAAWLGQYAGRKISKSVMKKLREKEFFA